MNITHDLPVFLLIIFVANEPSMNLALVLLYQINQDINLPKTLCHDSGLPAHKCTCNQITNL